MYPIYRVTFSHVVNSFCGFAGTGKCVTANDRAELACEKGTVSRYLARWRFSCVIGRSVADRMCGEYSRKYRVEQRGVEGLFCDLAIGEGPLASTFSIFNGGGRPPSPHLSGSSKTRSHFSSWNWPLESGTNKQTHTVRRGGHRIGGKKVGLMLCKAA